MIGTAVFMGCLVIAYAINPTAVYDIHPFFITIFVVTLMVMDLVSLHKK